MEPNMQHEDLLMRLRIRLNESRVKLWEPPYVRTSEEDNGISQELQELAKKYSAELSQDESEVLSALRELQQHSLARSQDNAHFSETGLATFRVKVTGAAASSPRELRVQLPLVSTGVELVAAVATQLGVADTRVKLIVNGKVLKPEPTLEEQAVKNGAQVLALIMAESPEDVQRQERLVRAAAETRAAAALLAGAKDDLDHSDEYMKLEDQAGNALSVPPSERRALLIALALHARARAAAHQGDHALALLLCLEADTMFNECGSELLKSVDNPAVLQLDIAWSCVRLRVEGATAAALPARLAAAQRGLARCYGPHHQRLIHLKGTNANERVLLMRLYLLQGIVAYHQNQREEARACFDRAEVELNALRVDPASVSVLMELGWSEGAARRGLRAAGGAVEGAHEYLSRDAGARRGAREEHRKEREQRLLGVCLDGRPVNAALVGALASQGWPRGVAAAAARRACNHPGEALRLLRDEADLLTDSSTELLEEEDIFSSGESEEFPVEEEEVPIHDEGEPDEALVQELVDMGFDVQLSRVSLRAANNCLHAALDQLAQPTTASESCARADPSTSAATVDKQKKQKDKKQRARQRALAHLRATIEREDDGHLTSSLADEEEYLAQYRSLL